MPFQINVLTGNQDLQELPLRILTSIPESTDLAEGEVVIVNIGADRWLYWKTQGTLYGAKGTLV